MYSYFKNEGSPLLAQNEVRADIFSGSLAVFQSERVVSAGGLKGGAGGNSARPTNFGRNQFEFFRKHTASWEMSLLARPLRGLASRF
jgi:hypothetical protein